MPNKDKLRIFISYRRKDPLASSTADRLYESLEARFGVDTAFLDIHSMPLGEDFVFHISKTISSVDVLLVLMGPTWLTEIQNRYRTGSDDYVRIEIEQALATKKRIIAIQLDGTNMPHADEFPDSIKKLSRLTGMPFEQGKFYQSSVQILLYELEKVRKKILKENPVPFPVKRNWFLKTALACFLIATPVVVFSLMPHQGNGGGSSNDKPLLQPSPSPQPVPQPIISLISKEETPSPETIKNFKISPSRSVRFVWIPPGTFTMGNDQSKAKSEKPAHSVTLQKGFWIASKEFTVADWDNVNGFGQGSDSDASKSGVSWFEILGNEDGRSGLLVKLTPYAPDGWHYSIPTEAQWEYAAQQSIIPGTAIAENLKDIKGGLPEWCYDWFDGNYQMRAPHCTDPVGVEDKIRKVVRGNPNSSTNIIHARAGLKTTQKFDSSGLGLGFRLILEKTGKAE